MFHLTNATWRKSSRSQQGGECVELAGTPGHVAVRDSKNPTGPTLLFSRGEFTGFVSAAKRDRFAR